MGFTKKIIFFTLLFISTEVFANIGKVVAFNGDAVILRDGQEIKISKNSIIFEHDKIQTKNNTKVQLLFNDQTIISIGKNSLFQVSDYLYNEEKNDYKAEFDMLNGAFRTITGKIGKIAPEKFKLKTKSASIGIRGTQIVLNITNTKEDIFCTEGKIFVEKDDENLSSIVNAGKFITIEINEKNSFEIKDIKESDIKEINENILIKENLPEDNITKVDTIENNLVGENEIPSTTNTPINSLEKQIVTEEDKITQTVEEQLEAAQEKEEIAQDNAESDLESKTEELAQAQEDVEEAQTALEAAQAALDNAQTVEEQEAAQAALDSAQEELATAIETQEDAQEEVNVAQTVLTEINENLGNLSTALSKVTNTLEDLTPSEYFLSNNSVATYSGNFNNYEFDSGQQYLQDVNKDKVAIPSDTTISMDVDFGAITNQISNGEINISDVGDSTSRTLTFDGSIDSTDSSFILSPTGDTKGSGGSGNFYGSNADTVSGDLNMKTSDNVQISGSFDATKQ